MLALTIAALLSAAPVHAQSYAGSGSAVNSGTAPVTPDYYTVAPGDTLWDISRTFLGNPEYWPRLWAINEYITNPHWIYPGNRIAFRLGTDVEPPQVDLEVTAPPQVADGSLSIEYPEGVCGPDVRFVGTHASDQYSAPAFLADSDDVEVYGEVYKARTRQYWLAEGNLIYLKLEDPDAFDCGDIVSVFRRSSKKVRDPDKRSTNYGSAYRVVADARIVHRADDIVTAVVRDSYLEMERGDLVGPLMPVSVELEAAAPQGELEGRVVGRATEENMLIGTGETVFVDIGRADGVRVGDTMYVVVRQDEALDRKKEDESLPESVTGRIVIVRVDEYTATAVITDAARPIEMGQRLVQTVDRDR